jgi:hypothetical protein
MTSSRAYAHPRLIYPPRFNRYSDGGSYGFHSDSALLHVANSSAVVRSDMSATLFLSEPDEYDGGELEIETSSDVQAVKLTAGDMVLYPSGALHRVLPVTRGARIASFFLGPEHGARRRRAGAAPAHTPPPPVGGGGGGGGTPPPHKKKTPNTPKKTTGVEKKKN